MLKAETPITAVVGPLITAVVGPHIRLRLRVELGRLHQIPNIPTDRSTLVVHTTVQPILNINLEPEVPKPNLATLLQGIMACDLDTST